MFDFSWNSMFFKFISKEVGHCQLRLIGITAVHTTVTTRRMPFPATFLLCPFVMLIYVYSLHQRDSLGHRWWSGAGDYHHKPSGLQVGVIGAGDYHHSTGAV